ncbi:MAG TPA: sugar phosphate isomerase/epimerase family protein [Phycisphaerales bacterium]|nr:sugar phosphate isomerase/epimerase family protein [Phycisphaerales bacterium]
MPTSPPPPDRSRREFVAASLVAAGAAVVRGAEARGAAPADATKGTPNPAAGDGGALRSAPPSSPRRTPIGVSTYSFWHFRGDPPPLPALIDTAAAMGFDGVEILHRMMPTEENAYLQELKHRAFVNGVALMGFSIHQGFVSPDPDVRQRNVEHTLRCIELAYRMGIPTLRLNTGRWGTIASFDDLMANRGIEPALEGHTEDEAFAWCIDAIGKLLPKAAECGVCMGLENHWGLGRTAAGVLRIIEAVRSPWLRATLDTGNFLEDMYPQMERMAPETVLVQAKTYYGGGEWYDLDIDYARVASILRAVDYRGWISLEYEGKGDPAAEVPRSLAMLRSTFDGA